MTAVYKVAKKLQAEMNLAAELAYQACLKNLSGPESTCAQSTPVSPAEAFKKIYRHGVNFIWGCSGCTALGLTVGKNTVMFRDFYSWGDTMLRNVNLVIHELGHIFDNLYTYSAAGRWYGPALALTTDLASNRDGFGPMWDYQQSRDITGNEIFADMFVHWVQGGWATDTVLNRNASSARIDWLNQNMPNYMP
ncbi:MAG: hypothetical protein JNK81_12185 [Anaerolineales bacterium]|nr:hypothetical protein [Anaerolineales bacterium]